MFGLANRSVVAAIERLPGAEQCKGYTPTTFDESVVLGNAESEKGNAQLSESNSPIGKGDSMGNAQLSESNSPIGKGDSMGNTESEKDNAESASKPRIPQGDGQTDESDFDMEDEFDDDDDDEEEEAEAVEDEFDDDDSPSLSDSLLVESDAESEAPRGNRSKRPAKQRSTPKHSTQLRVRCRITPEGVEAEDTLM